jgi:hypothetical protein
MITISRPVAANGGHVALPAWSRRWWAAWLHLADRGESAAAMEQAARRGHSWRMPASSVPSVIGLVDVAVNSPAFAAWATHYQRRGIRLPRPSFAPVIFVPSAMPPTSVGPAPADFAF